MVKSIFFDIDGTLISFKTHKMPESTRKALNELRKKEMQTFYCNRKISFCYS